MQLKKFTLLALTCAISIPAFAADHPETLTNEYGLQSFSGPEIFGRKKCNKDDLIDAKASVERGVDGDTVMVKASDGGSYSVRMMGIDTPETHYLGHSQGEWGEKAGERLREILPAGTKVRLEFSDEGCDKYGRVLAFVWKGKLNVNAQMAKEGLAVSYCVGPNVTHCEEIGKNVNEAVENRLGMFSDSDVELPYDFRHRISNREWTYFVGNIQTNQVFRPGNNEQVPVGDRVFFFKKKDIEAPFFLAD